MELFEEVDNLSNDFQSYDPKFILDSWLSHPNHRFSIYHPAINRLFCLLDEELLIGEPPIRTGDWWNLNLLSGIRGTVFAGTGDYYMQPREEVEFWHVEL